MNKYIFYRVIKLKSHNWLRTLSTFVKGTLSLTIIYMFFVFGTVFKYSKKQEIIINANKSDDLASVDTSGELISLLSAFETLFFLLGWFLLTVYTIYLIIYFSKKYMINKESLAIKKLNGSSGIELAVEFTLEQMFEIPFTLLAGVFIAKLLVKNTILKSQNFWLFKGLSVAKLSVLSPELIVSMILFLLLLAAVICAIFYRKIKNS